MPIDFSSITKGDIVNDAYSQMRISGLTVTPTPSDLELAINRLEILAQELATRSMDGGYNFSSYPDLGDVAGIKPAYLSAYSSNLAIRLIPDFNKQVPQSLFATAQMSTSILAADTALTRETPYPDRMPLGSGNTNRAVRWGRFYQREPDIPEDAQIMRVGDVNHYYIDFSDYVVFPEYIESFDTESSESLVISNEVAEDGRVTFTALAKKTTDDYSYVTIQITTDAGMVTKRTMPFYVGK